MRAGSFAGAARLTGLAHPTVRRRIESLEKKLDLILFTRERDGMRPTAAARKLLRMAEIMEGATLSFLETASTELGRAAGVVRLTCGEITAIEILPPLIAELRAHHPALFLELSIDGGTGSVLRGEADIAVSMVRPIHKALHGRRVGSIRAGLFAHRRYLAVVGAPACLAELRNFALIGLDSNLMPQIIQPPPGLDVDVDDIAYRCDSYDGQLAAIRAGVGIGAIQVPIALRDPSLRRVLEGEFNVELEPWIVTHEDLRNDPRIRTVFDALVDYVSAYAGAESLDV
jgi:DNA-binding transcriptional LysR family regulator